MFVFFGSNVYSAGTDPVGGTGQLPSTTCTAVSGSAIDFDKDGVPESEDIDDRDSTKGRKH